VAESGLERVSDVGLGGEVGGEDVFDLVVQHGHTLVGDDELCLEVHHQHAIARHPLRPLHSCC
jgi:hypothetical protein